MSELPGQIGDISPEEHELFKLLLEKKGIDTLGMQTIPRRTQTSPCQLSFAQQRLWFLSQLEPDSPLYNMSAAVRLKGSLNIAALAQSFNEIVRRHEVLRTTFVTVNGQPVQVIAPTLTLVLPVVKLQELPELECEAAVLRLTTEEAQRPFNLDQSPLLRTTLLQLGEAEHVLLFTMHHIVSDGWSIEVLVREVVTLYEAFCSGKPSPLSKLPIQYGDFAVWQRQWLQGEVLETQLAYWRQQLNSHPVLQLPTNRPRSAVQTFRGASTSFSLSTELTEALKALSQKEDATLFMTLLAAFKTWLHRYTGQEDILVGSPIANRNWAEVEGLIGFFVNTLVLRTNLSGNPSFRELLGQVREVALGAYAHQDMPFEYLVEKLQLERNLSQNPLFQVMFVLQNASIEEFKLPGLSLSFLKPENRTAKFDLSLWMQETDSGVTGEFEYNTDLFDAGTIDRMVEHFRILLEGIVVSPGKRIEDLPLLSATEQYQLLIEWNDTQAEYPKDKCIHQLFEAQVERSPDAIAVVFEDQQLTYRELNARANRIAHHLRALGVGPEVLVGIYVERSIQMVVGLLGILKAGGAYVPLDPAYPKERLTFMLSDSQVPVLLTQKNLVPGLPEHQAQMVCLDIDWEAINEESEEKPTSKVKPTNLAYILYTSGSTGRPKGVAIEHHSSVALLYWALGVFTPKQLAGVLASTSICFDLSVFELFVPLSCGGKVILAENILHLPTLPAAKEVTLINTVASAITELQRTGIPASVGTVNLAGEPLQNQLVQRLYQQNIIQQVFNLYGPSEDTTYSTFACVSRQDLENEGVSKSPPIGRPIANTQVYILDPHLQPVPIGVPGELHIGGAGLARGYFNRPELTSEKFIPNPFSEEPGSRLYKTGDLARYLPNGNVQFLGRIDHQVKIRGFRIELGEIEAVLAQFPGVRQPVVLAQEDEPNNKQLVAYIVPSNEQTPTISDLRNFLKQQLPDYMVPSAFVRLEVLPLTPNGKVNRRQLPKPEGLPPELEATYVAPQTEEERTIATIWQAVLNVEKVGIYDNFFDLGGHSLLMVQVHSKLREVFNKDISIVDLFTHPTISSLARYLCQGQSEPLTSQPSSESLSKTLRDRPDPRRAALRQQRQRRKSHQAVKK